MAAEVAANLNITSADLHIPSKHEYNTSDRYSAHMRIG